MNDDTRRCNACLEDLPVSSFHDRKRYRSVRCKSCEAAATAAWRKANPEKQRAANERSNQVRAAQRARAWQPDRVCERCDGLFSQERSPGAVKKVCWPCREVDWAWRLYGLTSVTLPAFYEAHGNKCDICGGTESPTQWGNRLHIDHDHNARGASSLRGLLCHGCNTAIGLMNEDPARLMVAVEYLVKHRR